MTIHVYDGNNFFHRLIQSDPRPMSTIYTMACALSDTHLWVWDGPMGNYQRREMLPRYKMQRKTSHEDITETMNMVRELIGYSTSTQIRLPEYEGDDVIAFIAQYFAEKGQQVIVNSNDYDLVQLCVHPNISTIAKIKPEMPPELVRLNKAWVGDPSDNVPGIAGFGKTAWDQHMHNPALMEMVGNALSGNWNSDLADSTFTSRQKRIATALNENDGADLATMWKVVGFIPIPKEKIFDGLQQGTNEPHKARELMDKWLQPYL